MKVSVIIGSPRKKDSYGVIRDFEELIKQELVTEFDYIHLGQADLRPCVGCNLCFSKGEDLCPLKDDHKDIITSLEQADFIIISSPVYAYQVSGLMKNFIDRSSYLFHRPTLMGKPCIVVTTTDGGGGSGVADYLKMTASGWGMTNLGQLNVISPKYYKNHHSKGVFSFDQAYHDRLRNRMARIMKRLIASKDQVSFYDVFLFNCLRSKTYTSDLDLKYWQDKGWMDAVYYKALPPFKTIFGHTIKGLIHFMAKRKLSKLS